MDGGVRLLVRQPRADPDATEGGRTLYFETEHEGARHPHYGRFLDLIPDELVTLTWMTGVPGMGGAETVVTVELEPTGAGGTHLRLTHAGFHDQAGVEQHQAWHELLALLDDRLAG